MKQAWEILTEVAKDMPGGPTIFYAFLCAGLCVALTLILEMLLATYKTMD